MFSITELEIQCPECKGIGYVTHPEWKKYWDKHKELFEQNLKNRFDKSTAWDKATEELIFDVPDEVEEIECCECNGNGTILTEEGENLLIS